MLIAEKQASKKEYPHLNYLQQQNKLEIEELEEDEVLDFSKLTIDNTYRYLLTQCEDESISITQFKSIKSLDSTSLCKVIMVKNKIDSMFNNIGDKLYEVKIINKKDIKMKQDKKYTLQVMNNQFIAQLQYAFQTERKLYLFVKFQTGVFIFVMKGQLSYLLRQCGKFYEDIVIFYAAELLIALQYLHSHDILCSGIRLENILLDKDGHLKIIDYGLSKLIQNKIIATEESQFYLSPERIMGQTQNQVSDWFSFGSFIFDMLIGKPIFYNKNKYQILKNIVTQNVVIPDKVSESTRSLLQKLLKRQPQQRIQDISTIKNHQFFQRVDFQLIKKKQIKPPFTFPDQDPLVIESLQQSKKDSIQFGYKRTSYLQQTLKMNFQNSKKFMWTVQQQIQNEHLVPIIQQQ